MSTIDTFKQELENVEREISSKTITDELYKLMALLNKRVFLGNKIAQYNWDKLDWIEKEKKS